jgi:hypothetical protein
MIGRYSRKLWRGVPNLLSFNTPEVGEVADQAASSATDLPEAGDTVDTTTGN